MQYKKSCIVFFLLLILTASAFAQSNTQTNFSISPPPLGYPEYPDESAVSSEFNGTFAYISADEFTMRGIFAGWIPRYGGSWGAIEGMIGIFVMNGDIDTGYGKDYLNFVGFDLAPVAELPLVNEESFKFIFFGGFDLMLMTTSFTTPDPYSSGDTMTLTLTTGMYGPVLGIQMHIGFGGTFMFSPFIMVKSLRGSTDVMTDPAYAGMQSSYDIPATTIISYGFDLIDKDGVTLSGLLNMAGKTKDNESYNVYMFGMSIKL